MITREQIVDIATTVLGVPSEKITDDTPLKFQQANSIAMRVFLVSGLEILSFQDMDDMTVGDIFAAVRKQDEASLT